MSDLELALSQRLEAHLSGDTPPNLAAAIRYSLLAPGKRIRPRLLLAAARLVGLSAEAALPAALALEMIHCFTLIHDDLPCMDDDDFRRGRPSNHKAHGEAVALLAGDALIPLAIDTLSEAAAHVPPPCFLRALLRFSQASGPRGVVGGQADELLLSASSRLDALERVHRLKTGALFAAALGLPCDLAGVDEAQPQGAAIARFGAELGRAFQIADDLEDAGEKPDASNILSQLPEREARLRTATGLRAAMGALAQAWGEPRAGELLGLAREVLARVEGAGA